MKAVLFLISLIPVRWREAAGAGLPIALSIAVLSAMSCILSGLKHDALQIAETSPQIVIQRLSGGRISSMTQKEADEVASRFKGGKITKRVWGFLPVELSGEEDRGTDASRGSVALCIVGVKAYLKTILKKNDVIIGPGAAYLFNAAKGDEITLSDHYGNSQKFNVIEVLGPDSPSALTDALIGEASMVSTFLGYGPDAVTDVGISYAENAQEAATELQTKGYRIIGKDELTRTVSQSYGERGGTAGLVWFIMLMTILMASWSRARAITGFRRREIYILRASGYTPTEIMTAHGLEALIISAFASLTGATAGIAWAASGAAIIRNMFMGWSSLYPGFSPSVIVNIPELSAVIAAGILPFTLATLIPSWLAGLDDPKEWQEQ